MSEISGTPSQPVKTGSCAGWLAIGVVWFWIGIVLFVRFTMEILGSAINPGAAESGLIPLPLLSSLAILLPCLFMMVIFRNAASSDQTGFTIVLKTWTWASIFILVSLPARLGDTTSLQKTVLYQALTGLAFLGLLVLSKRGQRLNAQSESPALAYRSPAQPILDWRSGAALLIVGLLGFAWFAWGALGSILDSLLAITSGLVFGIVAAYLIETVFIQPYLRSIPTKTTAFLAGGLVISTTLVIMSSALGYAFGVMQVITLITLAPLGWVWMGLRLMSEAAEIEGELATSSSLAQPNKLVKFTFPALLIGLASALPALFFDANELALIISASQGEVLQWALQASLAVFLIGLLVALLLFIILLSTKSRTAKQNQSQVNGKSRTWLIYIAAGSVWLAGMTLYWASGQPGFFGERMFIVLNAQADLSGVTEIEGYTQRRQWVYDRLIAHAETSQRPLRQTLDQWRIPYQPYYLVNGIELPGNPLLRLWLEQQPEVERVLASPRLRPLAEPVPVSTGTEPAPEEPGWNLTLIGADRVWEEFNITGQGIVIGQSDSGVQWDHPELVEGYRGKTDHNYNWFDPWNHSPAPVDHGGHGTHTLGSILGQHTGVAPGATWIACANLDRNLGNPAFYLDCMQFMLAPFPLDGDPFQDGRPDLGAMVLNNSWGCPEMEGCDQESLQAAVQVLRMAGIFTVASAGNDGPKCASITDPLSIYPEVFTVGAIDNSGSLANFSSLGPVAGASKPDLVAPGEAVLSSFPGNTYAQLSGTSMAGPHVAGVVALLWSANPQLIGDIEQTETILRQNSQPYSSALPDCSGVEETPSTAVGMGILDAYQAVKSQK